MEIYFCQMHHVMRPSFPQKKCRCSSMFLNVFVLSVTESVYHSMFGVRKCLENHLVPDEVLNS